MSGGAAQRGRSRADRTSAVPPDGGVRIAQIAPVEHPVPALVADRDEVRQPARDLEADRLVQRHRGMVVAADVEGERLDPALPGVVDQRRDQRPGRAPARAPRGCTITWRIVGVDRRPPARRTSSTGPGRRAARRPRPARPGTARPRPRRPGRRASGPLGRSGTLTQPTAPPARARPRAPGAPGPAPAGRPGRASSAPRGRHRPVGRHRRCSDGPRWTSAVRCSRAVTRRAGVTSSVRPARPA